MCGIVGYTGQREAEPILLEGLKRLEYRGYDSAGLATLAGSKLFVRKSAGRIADLVELLSRQPAPGTCGISHTLWATHGPANDLNAHLIAKHLDGDLAEAVRLALAQLKGVWRCRLTWRCCAAATSTSRGIWPRA